MNTELNLTHSELVSELFHVMQDTVLETYTEESEYTSRLKVLWDYLENADMNTLETLYNVYY
jgi:hypothetical protein